MKRIAALGLAGALACLLLAAPASAGVNVSIGIGLPLPVVVVPAEPDLVVVPGTPVYYAPGLQADIFFYGGWWWTPYQGRWYRSRHNNGPWGYMQRPPGYFSHMPPNYRGMAGHERRIPYGQFQQHWREWDRQGRYGGRDWNRGQNRERGQEMRMQGHDRGHDNGRGHDKDRNRHDHD